eukprot:6667372-Heterocapsa_arctica.AAC.1
MVAEIALDEACRPLGLSGLTHIPGLSNVQADVLSRLTAPEPNIIVPDELLTLPQDSPPSRDHSFWLTLGALRRPFVVQ